MGSKIYLTVLLITLLAVRRCQQPITCDAGRFKAGQTASVTCNFHRSLEEIGHHVYVVHHPVDAPDDFLGNRIVTCHRSDSRTLICEATKGVQINNNITDHLIFHIPNVTTDFAGHYLCQLVPPDDTVMVSCSLTVEDTVTPKENDAEPESSCLWITITVLIAIVCLLVGILYKVYRMRRNSNRRNAVKNSNANNALESQTNFNNKHDDTVSGQPGLPFRTNGGIELNKDSHRCTPRTGSLINSTKESQNDPIDIHSGQVSSTVTSNVPNSYSCRSDNDSCKSMMYSSWHLDDLHSSNEKDGSFGFNSSRESLLDQESRCSSSSSVLSTL